MKRRESVANSSATVRTSHAISTMGTVQLSPCSPSWQSGGPPSPGVQKPVMSSVDTAKTLFHSTPSAAHLACHTTMCAVTHSHTARPSARWYLMPRSKGTPKSASSAPPRATGNVESAMKSDVMWPSTRAAFCAAGNGSFMAALSVAMRE